MIVHKDVSGRKIEIGAKVAYIQDYKSSSEMHLGTVTGFTDKFVEIYRIEPGTRAVTVRKKARRMSIIVG